MTDLTIDVIRSYGFEENISKPDWDDVQLEIHLPNGLSLTTLTVCCNEPTEVDSLEGLDGYIYIETKEELDELINLSYEEVLDKVKSENKDFKIEDYLEL